MSQYLYDLFSWLMSKISGLLPFKLAVNPSEKVIREQLRTHSVATNNQPLQDLIVDIISHLPSLDEFGEHHDQEAHHHQHHPNVMEMIPHLFEGTFKEAVDFCKNNDQLLFVYLHSPGHDDSYEFIQHVFCRKEFIEFVNANFVVFASSIKSSEGFAVSNQIQATSFPFLAILMGSKVYWKMDGLSELMTSSQQSGIHLIDALLTQLISEHERLDAQLVIQRNEKQMREFERRAREEQDRAYEESLRIDREKEEKRLQIEREKERALNQFKLKLFENETKRNEIRQNLVFYSNEPNYKNIKLKLPNGTETQNKFSLHLTFGDLHRFIHAYSGSWQPSRFSKLETDYELTLNSFPKRQIPFDDSQSLASIEGKALLIYVRESEHDEDEQFALQHSL
ncbi:hypothetical protein C9374_009178 [Naegleria lovaniensis]|uniref:UAS domain-containing protein n=1 Tax=Naegleria lovaniensis TaxID=51637 RepID=A0AA88GDY9_NAELO|nr:uncharacterized protein C9374_009178 [Naegleria lovaniensis]KAG2377662.1 hypothetical protein C9374_009178 [Naegleria lovaniensis]